MKDESHRISVVALGRRKVGRGQPTYIIAEAGVNHDGNVDAARRLIDAAKQAGADAVKFQMFSAQRLVAASAPMCTYQENHDDAVDQRALLRRLELDDVAFESLRLHAATVGIDFLVTPFGLPELDYVATALNVPAIKIASPDIVNTPLLTAAARTGLPLILSTGAATAGEIKQACKTLADNVSSARLILLHCVSAYPTPLAKARLGRIAELRQTFNVPVGYSDHTSDVETGHHAVLAGACVLEKHLTLDRTASGPDHFFSLQPAEFTAYVARARQAEELLGPAGIDYGPEEEEVRRLSRGRVVAARHITTGQRLTAESLVIQRPGDGIGPLEWHAVLGKIATTDIPAETPLTWSMLR